MDLYHTILAEFYAEYGHLVTNIDAASIIHDRCYQALCQSKRFWRMIPWRTRTALIKSRKSSPSLKPWAATQAPGMISDNVHIGLPQQNVKLLFTRAHPKNAVIAMKNAVIANQCA